MRFYVHRRHTVEDHTVERCKRHPSSTARCAYQYASSHCYRVGFSRIPAYALVFFMENYKKLTPTNTFHSAEHQKCHNVYGETAASMAV